MFLKPIFFSLVVIFFYVQRTKKQKVKGYGIRAKKIKIKNIALTNI
jgi:hypothetical protein